MSEATTIDTLSLEITSNSTGAAEGIDKLAVSLGKLKQSGSIGVAVKNLNNLSDALKKLTPVTSNANKLSALADSINKLSQAGSMARVINQLNKLPGAVKGLENLKIDDTLAKKADELATALIPLSNIKTGGLGTMINALGKVGKVTESLDGATIQKFADRVEVLTKRLEPLSTKMTTIQTGLRGINSSAKTAGNGVKEFSTKVNASTVNLASMVTIIQGVVSALMPLVRMFSKVIGEALEWDGVAARFGRGFGDQASEVYTWVQRLNKEMGINVQEFMQYSSVYATMLEGYGVAQKDAAKMALGYTELTYDIWAGYNDIYKRYEDAAVAVRAAIAGETEPIQKAGLDVRDTALAQTAAMNDLTYSTQNTTNAQKSYLRYLSLVRQANDQGLVGTYADELDTAEGLTRTLTQQLKSLSQAFGSLFLPILIKVIPWLSAFVELLTEAVAIVAGFFGVTIQPVKWGESIEGGVGAIEGVGDAADGASEALDGTAGAVGKTKEALEDLKKATLAIDELNVISPPEEKTGGGGSGGPDPTNWDKIFGEIESLWDESIFEQIESQVDAIKEKIRSWLPVIETIGGALAGLGIATLLKNLGDAMEKMNLLQKMFATVATVAIEAALVFVFADNYLESGNLLYLIGEALVTAAAGYLLFRTWGVGGAVMALGVSILAQLVAIEMNLADGTVSISSPETWIQGITTTLTGALGGAILSKYTAFFPKEGFVIGLGVTASLVLLAIRMGAIESGEISSDSIEAWIMTIGSTATAALAGKWLGAALYTGGGPMGALIGVTAGLILNLVGTISVKGEDFGNEISDWISGAITVGMSAFTATKIWKVVSPIITPALKGIVPKIGTALSSALKVGWTSISSAVAAIPVWGWIVAAIAAVLALAIVDYDFTDIGNKIGKALGKACGAVVNFVADIGGAIWKGLKAAFTWVKNNITWDNVTSLVAALFKKETWTEIIWPKIKEIGKSIWDGLWGGIKDGAKNLWGNITEFVNGFIQGFKDGFEIHSPSKKMMEIGKAILDGLLQPLSLTALRDRVKEMWNKAKEWWNGKTGMEKVEISVKLFKSGWSTITKWIGSIPAVSQAVKLAKSGWTSIKKWIGSIPAVSQAVKLAKSGWSSVKKWVGSMPTLSAGISLAKSGWTTIKKWLGIDSAFKLKFTLPKIGINWGTKTVLGFKISYPSSFYTYAKGGFPDMGELFVAREAGPEMVGRIGSKTTVANNEQIVTAVSEGVYAAVLAAMKQSEGNGTQPVNVYLDSRQIASSVEQRQHERGASLMGRQVYAY